MTPTRRPLLTRRGSASPTRGPRRRAVPRVAVLFASLLAVPLAATACGDDDVAPRPGPALIRLVSPNGAEGGAVFRVGDPDVTDVTTDVGVVFVRRDASGTSVVVVRDEPGELRFRMEIDDIHRLPSVEVVEVSGPGDALRASLAGYEVEPEVEG